MRLHTVQPTAGTPLRIYSVSRRAPAYLCGYGVEVVVVPVVRHLDSSHEVNLLLPWLLQRVLHHVRVWRRDNKGEVGGSEETLAGREASESNRVVKSSRGRVGGARVEAGQGGDGVGRLNEDSVIMSRHGIFLQTPLYQRSASNIIHASQ